MFKLAVHVCKYVFVFIALYFQYYNLKHIIGVYEKKPQSGFSADEKKPKHGFSMEPDKYAGRQFTLICLFHVIASCILYQPVMGAISMAFFIAAFFCVRLFFGKGCRMLWNNTFFLMDMGFIMLLRIKPSSAERQLMWFGLGFAAAMICRIVFNERKIRKSPVAASPDSPPNPISNPLSNPLENHLPNPKASIGIPAYFFIILTPVLLVLPFFIGITINGATNWVSIYGHSFQPSEIAKISLTLGLAGILRPKKISLARAIFVCSFSANCVMILVLQRDLGGALIFFAIFLVMFYSATGNKLLALAAVGLACCAAVPAYFLFPHVQVRVTAWLNPWSDISGSGYQILQSLFAIGTWGPMGGGLTLGMPGFIPVAESDFIFSAITEEFGVFFSIGMIFSFVFILYFGFSAAKRHTDRRKFLTSVGLSALIAFQAFLIMGACVRLIPITGVTLPFVSYGGSSMIVCMAIIGMLGMLGTHGANEPHGSYGPHGIKEMVLPESPVGKAEEVAENHLDKRKAKFRGKSALRDIDRDKKKPSTHVPGTGTLRMFYLLYLLVIIFLIKVAFIDSEDVTVNSYNPRMRVSDTEITRGNIYDRHMRVLAASDGGSRSYPYAEKTAHIVGYTDRGGAGVEARYNFELQKAGAEVYKRIVNIITGEPIIADDIILTIDAELNSLIYDHIYQTGFKGAAAVIEPSTGRVLALCSAPGYDPNTIRELWPDLSEDDENSPLVNRATQGLYTPGSIFKLITAAAAMKSGESGYYDCAGEAWFEDDERMRCFNQKAHGTIDMAEAFKVSCNCYFADTAIKLGGRAIHDTAVSAGFGVPLEFSLAYNQSSFSLSASADIHDLVQTGIGQGRTLVTPLHMAMLAAAVGNGGIMMRPYILEHIRSNGREIKKTIPQKLGDAVSLEESLVLKDMMVEVVRGGTGTSALVAGIAVAGKTGTAENPAGDDHGWFIAFAPADNPKVALAVLLENSDGPRKAMPIAREIIEFVLDMN